MNDKRMSSGAASPTGSLPCRSQVVLCFDSARGQLLAELTLSQRAFLQSPTQLKRLLESQGYRQLYLDPGALESLSQRIAGGEEGCFLLAERKDASFTISISRDLLKATLSTTPNYGGAPLTREKLTAALEAEGIPPVCWQREALEQACRQPSVTNLCIASFVPPQRGQDARFESLLTEEAAQPEIDESGTADLRQIYHFQVVEPGTPLLRRVPATAGEPGVNLRGEPIEPPAANNPGFAKKLQGCAPSEQDPDLLVATIKGHPTVSAQSAQVDPVLILAQVNVATGNIDFDGAVEVKGDVESGFSINASGDVNIKGTLVRSCVNVGGDLIIGGGVIGEEVEHVSDIPAGKPSVKLPTQLRAGGLLAAKFISYAQAEADGDIKVREYILHSNVSAGGLLLAGQEGGRGAIIGGYCHSDNSVLANSLGNDAYQPTHVSAGREDERQSRLQEAVKLRDRRVTEELQLAKILTRLQQSGSAERLGQVTLDKARKIRNTINDIRQQVEQLNRDIVELERQLQQTEPARVVARRRLFPNVTVTIEGVSQLWKSERSAAVMIKQGDKLTFMG